MHFHCALNTNTFSKRLFNFWMYGIMRWAYTCIIRRCSINIVLSGRIWAYKMFIIVVCNCGDNMCIRWLIDQILQSNIHGIITPTFLLPLMSSIWSIACYLPNMSLQEFWHQSCSHTLVMFDYLNISDIEGMLINLCPIYRTPGLRPP